MGFRNHDRRRLPTRSMPPGPSEGPRGLRYPRAAYTVGMVHLLYDRSWAIAPVCGDALSCAARWTRPRRCVPGIAACRCIWAVARLRPHRLRSLRVEAETRFSQSRVLTSEKLRKQMAVTPLLGGAANGTLWLFCPVGVLFQVLSR
jgi:hypothetical protein